MEQAQAALKSGDKAQARALLMQIVEGDETNEQAWLWLAGAIEDPTEQMICLENVLHINPDNQRAQQGLDWLRAKHPEAAPPPQAPPPMTGATVALEQAAPPMTGATIAMEQAAPPMTGATIAMEQAAPPMQAPPMQSPPMQGEAAPPIIVNGVADPQPCPRCGTPNPLARRSCSACRVSLVEKVNRQKGSTTGAKIAGIMGIMHDVFVYGGLGLSVMLLASAYRAAMKSLSVPPGATAEEAEAIMANLAPQLDRETQPLMVLGGFFFVFVLIGVLLGVGLIKRNIIAYWLGWVYYGLTFLGYVFIFVSNAIATSMLAGLGSPNGDGGIGANVLAAILGIVALFPLWFLVILGMLAWAYPGFTKRERRLVIVDEAADADTHYNRGVGYQRRQYWYQAMVEWQKAVQLRPQDPKMRHALGLIYAQLKQPQAAMQELDEALALAPDDPAIAQDREKLMAEFGSARAA